MTDTDVPVLRIAGPADLLRAVPYLLGFHPEESLVVIGLDESRIVVTARLDLADLADTPVAADTLEAIRRGAATAVFGAIFTERHTDIEVIGRCLTGEARRAGLKLLDILVVTGGRWRSLGCDSPQCCPPEGTAMPANPTALDAAATYAGLTGLPNRDALTSMFTPLPGSDELTVELLRHQGHQVSAVLNRRQASYDRSVVRALFAAQRAAQAGVMPTTEQAARFGVALQSYGVRDAVWLAVDDGRLGGIELWVNLARRLPAPYRAAPLFLAGWRAFRDGNGALAGIAADLALQSDPGYSAADLLRAALAHGVDPRTLPTLRTISPPNGGADATNA